MDLDVRSLDALLSAAFGGDVEVTSSERIAPWFVTRCRLTCDQEDVPDSVIVKRLREDASRSDPDQMLTECAALQFLGSLGLGVAPRVIGSDVAASIIVLEDLAPRRPLFDLINEVGETAAATELATFARTIGNLHAGTVGLTDAYYRRRETLGPVDPQRERERFLGWGWRDTLGYAETIGAPMPQSAQVEFARVRASFAEPGPFLALSNGDMAANNFLVAGEDGRIIDFEFAGYRHALTDAACLYVPIPGWMTVNDPIACGLESAYRRALARGVPQAEDDLAFGEGIAGAAAAMAIERLNRFPVLDARPPGHESRLHRISTLDAAAAVAETHDVFPDLSGWMRELSKKLRVRWPDADVDLASLPSYSVRKY